MASKKQYVRRLRKEFTQLVKEPVPHILAIPAESNILEWHYTIIGPDDSPYKGGYYHGKLKFPEEYPLKPPSIYMITPNGRFKPDVRLCLSMSDYHPELWNPLWSVGSILTGLLSFMLEDKPTTGSVTTTEHEKRQLAKVSMEFNIKDATYRKMFPDLIAKYNKEKEEQAKLNPTDSTTTTTTSDSSQTDKGGSFSDVVILLVIISVLVVLLAVTIANIE
eukprot:TRINITY_DN3176_c0_g2_i1.p1 TRINITY_DN3176_c0_g2~~TRINITY_DN3176_c0_g2_i1.p1  ORF type:complete len:220 (+),score=32.46 TRINITY_DN3176_c0_g2_i1:32-691(+)